MCRFYYSQIGSCMCSIKWWHCRWPWVTLNPKPSQFLHFALPFISLYWVNTDYTETSNLMHRLITASLSLWMDDKLSLKRAWSPSCYQFKFWETIDIAEMMQDRHSYNGRLIENHACPTKWHDCLEWDWWSLLLFKTFVIPITQEI